MSIILVVINRYKNTLLGIMTACIMLSGVFKDYIGVWAVWITVFLTVVQIVLLFYYDKQDKEILVVRDLLEDLKLKYSGFETMMQEIQTLCEVNVNLINNRISIKNKGLAWKIWCFDNVAMMCCKTVLHILMRMDNKNGDFSVSYIKFNEKKKEIKMVGYANKNEMPPSIYNKVRNIEVNNYYDAKLFRNNNTDYIFLLTKKEIIERFMLNKECKYEQYIGIPLVNSKNNLIGLLQIMALNDSRIANTKEDMRRITITYFRPFISMLVMFFMIDNMLYKYSLMNGDKK